MSSPRHLDTRDDREAEEREPDGRSSEQDLAEDREPESPLKLTKRSWFYVARKTLREFSKDECTDLAAALTYYAVLAMFPAAIALLSLVGLVTDGRHSIDTLMGILSDVGAGSVARHPRADADRAEQQRGRRGRAPPRPRRCAVVGVRVRRCVRPGHEPDVRDR